MVSLKDIEQSYITKNKEKLYLRNINLNIPPGEIYGIIGRSGAGKSALLKCINLIERPMTGVVSIDKMNYTVMIKNELREARKNIGMVPQQIQLLHNKTVFDNIILPLEFHGFNKDDITLLANQIIDLTGLTTKANLYPSQLSPAQKKCLAIARAMITKPKVLLCDELTAGLDNRSTQTLLKVLKEINLEFKTTMVLITNDIELIKKLCHRVGIMHQGEIIEESNVFDFFTAPKSEVGKDFIRTITKLEMPWVYRYKLKLKYTENTHPIVRMTFYAKLSPESIIGKAIEKHKVKVALLQAHQEIVQNKQVKVLIAELEGEEANIVGSIQYLTENGLHTEILGYVNDHT